MKPSKSKSNRQKRGRRSKNGSLIHSALVHGEAAQGLDQSALNEEIKGRGQAVTGEDEKWTKDDRDLLKKVMETKMTLRVPTAIPVLSREAIAAGLFRCSGNHQVVDGKVIFHQSDDTMARDMDRAGDEEGEEEEEKEQAVNRRGHKGLESKWKKSRRSRRMIWTRLWAWPWVSFAESRPFVASSKSIWRNATMRLLYCNAESSSWKRSRSRNGR